MFLVSCLIGLSIEWLINKICDWVIDYLLNRNDRSNVRFIKKLIDWSIDRSITQLSGCFLNSFTIVFIRSDIIVSFTHSLTHSPEFLLCFSYSKQIFDDLQHDAEENSVLVQTVNFMIKYNLR